MIGNISRLCTRAMMKGVEMAGVMGSSGDKYWRAEISGMMERF